MSTQNSLDFKTYEKKARQKNLDNVLTDLADCEPNLLAQIEKYSSDFGFSTHEIEEKIKTDVMFRAKFAKIPGRQGIHEDITKGWLKEKLGVEVIRLKTRGKTAVYISSNGEIEYKENETSKALDFRWDKFGIEFYAKHVYSSNVGGSQGNSFKLMQTLLKDFQNSDDPSKVFFVLAGGDYYNNERMSELQKYVRIHDPMSFAVHPKEVPEIVETYRK